MAVENSGRCKDCEHSIFCPTFGEYKCSLYEKRIYFPKLIRSCFVKKKSDKEKECHCKSCMDRGDEE